MSLSLLALLAFPPQPPAPITIGVYGEVDEVGVSKGFTAESGIEDVGVRLHLRQLASSRWVVCRADGTVLFRSLDGDAQPTYSFRDVKGVHKLKEGDPELSLRNGDLVYIPTQSEILVLDRNGDAPPAEGDEDGDEDGAKPTDVKGRKTENDYAYYMTFDGPGLSTKEVAKALGIPLRHFSGNSRPDFKKIPRGLERLKVADLNEDSETSTELAKGEVYGRQPEGFVRGEKDPDVHSGDILISKAVSGYDSIVASDQRVDPKLQWTRSAEDGLFCYKAPRPFQMGYGSSDRDFATFALGTFDVSISDLGKAAEPGGSKKDAMTRWNVVRRPAPRSYKDMLADAWSGVGRILARTDPNAIFLFGRAANGTVVQYDLQDEAQRRKALGLRPEELRTLRLVTRTRPLTYAAIFADVTSAQPLSALWELDKGSLALDPRKSYPAVYRVASGVFDRRKLKKVDAPMIVGGHDLNVSVYRVEIKGYKIESANKTAALSRATFANGSYIMRFAP